MEVFGFHLAQDGDYHEIPWTFRFHKCVKSRVPDQLLASIRNTFTFVIRSISFPTTYHELPHSLNIFSLCWFLPFNVQFCPIPFLNITSHEFMRSFPYTSVLLSFRSFTFAPHQTPYRTHNHGNIPVSFPHQPPQIITEISQSPPPSKQKPLKYSPSPHTIPFKNHGNMPISVIFLWPPCWRTYSTIAPHFLHYVTKLCKQPRQFLLYLRRSCFFNTKTSFNTAGEKSLWMLFRLQSRRPRQKMGSSCMLCLLCYISTRMAT